MARGLRRLTDTAPVGERRPMQRAAEPAFRDDTFAHISAVIARGEPLAATLELSMHRACDLLEVQQAALFLAEGPKADLRLIAAIRLRQACLLERRRRGHAASKGVRMTMQLRASARYELVDRVVVAEWVGLGWWLLQAALSPGGRQLTWAVAPDGRIYQGSVEASQQTNPSTFHPLGPITDLTADDLEPLGDGQNGDDQIEQVSRRLFR